MGIWQTVGTALGLVASSDQAQGAPQLVTAAQLPATQGDVAQVADLGPEVGTAFGVYTGESATLTRREAMRVPAFARGRNTICGTIGTLDLFAVKGGDRDDHWPLLEQPDPNASRQHTLTWTVDDLLHYGIAWWHITRRDGRGFPLSAEWVQRSRVQVDPRTGQARLDGRPVELRDLIRFDGPHEGVLAFGVDTLRGALALEKAVKRYAENPSPTTVLSDQRPADADVRDLTTTEVDDLLARWNAGNQVSPTRYVNRYLKAEAFGWSPQQLDLTPARQQAAVQVARLLGMPSRQVNAPSESSMTYSTTAADRQELIDGPLAMYLTAIEQRLSMPDVTPRGWRVRFDRDGFTQGTTQDRLENARTFVEAQLGDVDEARERYLDLPPRPDAPVTPSPPAAPPTDPEQEQP